MKKCSPEEMQKRKKSLEAIKKLPRHPIVIVLENIRSAYNVGALFRTADGALVEKMILTGITPVPPSTHIDKAALGATDAVPWEYVATAAEALIKLRAQGYLIVALEQTDSSFSYINPPELALDGRGVVLIFGNEVAGVSQETIDHCDYSMDIPMYGRASSLNVATAGGIIVYDVLRRLYQKFPGFLTPPPQSPLKT